MIMDAYDQRSTIILLLGFTVDLLAFATRITRMVPGFSPTKHTTLTRTPSHPVSRLVLRKATNTPEWSTPKNASAETKCRSLSG